MYELCACGVPMITYTFADNQLLGAKGFEQLGVASYCGDIRDGEFDLWRRIKESIMQYTTNQEYRFNIGSEMQSLVDGKGAVRLAQILTNYIGPQRKYRIYSNLCKRLILGYIFKPNKLAYN